MLRDVDRADAIRVLLGEPEDPRVFGELLICCEEDRTLPAVR